MSSNLVKLNYKDVLTQKEFFTFLKLFMDIVNNFMDTYDPPGGGGDVPDDLSVRSNSKSLLSTIMSAYTNDFRTLEKAINIPRKFIETKEMYELNKLRISDFSHIKKTIDNAYNNDKENIATQTLWYLVRIYKKLGRMTAVSLNTNLSKFMTDMESDTFKDHVTTLKLTDAVAKLKLKNEKFEEILIKRSKNENIACQKVTPLRKVCSADYENVYNVLVSIITLNPEYDFENLINSINGYTNYYNNISKEKLTRRATKKGNEKPSDAPDDLLKN